MMIKRSASLLALSAGLMLCFSACNKNDDKNPKDNFDRTAMLRHLGENQIIPAYEQFKQKADQMAAAITQFNAAPSVATLQTSRTAFAEAYKAWQHVSIYELGPAEQQMLREHLNKFPANTDSIRTRINKGSYDISWWRTPIKGFPALDYLLYASPDANDVVALYTTDAQAANRRQYLQAVADNVKTLAAGIHSAWLPSGGNYLNTFINAGGTDIGSSIGQLVNSNSSEINTMKSIKVGIPLGKQTLDVVRPEQVEAYYSGMSLELLKENLKAVRNVFLGNDAQGSNGPGFDDYLNAIEAKAAGGGKLSDAILNNIQTAETTINAIPGTLSAAVQTNKDVVNTAYIELQKLVVITKSDMPSALGVSITYQDNDGD